METVHTYIHRIVAAQVHTYVRVTQLYIQILPEAWTGVLAS